jgi:hypothetical protein
MFDISTSDTTRAESVEMLPVLMLPTISICYLLFDQSQSYDK